MHCQKCGEEIPDDSAFCNKCGAEQIKPVEPAATVATAVAGSVTLLETSLRFDSIEGIISSKANLYFAASNPADETDEIIVSSQQFKVPEPCVYHSMAEEITKNQRISVAAHRLEEFTAIAKPIYGEFEQSLVADGWEWAGQMESWWRQRYRRAPR